MPLRLLCTLSLLLLTATTTTAQTWHPPESQVPLPQAPQLLNGQALLQDQQDRIRARNEAAVNADLRQYAAQHGRRDSLLREAAQDYARIERERREQAEFNARFEASNKILYEAAY
jgi:hypothetical protein